MKSSTSECALLDQDYRQQQPLLRRKISLTASACVLLIVVFLSSAFLVTVLSFYWSAGSICYVNEPQPEEPAPRTVYYSRPRRSAPAKKAAELCIGFDCCTDKPAEQPWTASRLPTSVYPNDYQLELDFFQLNETHDVYTGVVDIVLEVRAATNYIVLHGDVLYSDVTVSRRASPQSEIITVNCVLPFPDTQTATITLGKQLQVGEMYDVRISFFRSLSVHGTGIFEDQFNKDQFGLQKSKMILTHFQPVHAREAFPCFDEPGFKAKFQLTVRHQNNTKIISNWDESDNFLNEAWIQTEFKTTHAIPTERIAFAVFYNDDFEQRTAEVFIPGTERPIQISVWARKVFFENNNGIFIDAPMDMIKNIFAALLDIFQDIKEPIIPREMKFLAVPEYPSDGVSHWGLVILTERSFLHDPMTTSELEHQRIALHIARQLAEQWCGNLVSFQWWTDLWLQQALANYLKYHAVHAAYPSWNIYDQFNVLELLPTMFDDGMSTSHPVVKSVNTATEIDELFDSIETVKATAILRMADYYMEKSTSVKNNTLVNIVAFVKDREYGFFIPDEFLNKYRIGSWSGPDFFDRWLLQSNYPKVFARFLQNTADNTYTFQVMQSRYLTAHAYQYDLYPPSSTPFNYIWYIPVLCRFGNESNKFDLNRLFFLDRQTMNFSFGILNYKYFYCNTDFAGYYVMDYSTANWEDLSASIDNNNPGLGDIDRANLINNAFLGAQTTEESYSVVREVTQFLYRSPYSGVLPWQALSYHVNRMLDVLEYESTYGVVQRYFRLVVRNFYQTNAASIWNDQGSFREQILKNIIIQLACRTQLQACIDKATELWNGAYPTLASGFLNHTIAAHAREVVYNTHFQNTYDDTEWIVIESDYHNFVDVLERHRLLEAMTQSRQPWHLYQLLYRDAEMNQDADVDLLDVLTLLARNPVGRELAWLYYRKNWVELSAEYGRTNQRLGQLLIDITATFEDEFHELELIDFLASTPGVTSNVDARFWALERANMNFWWILDNSEDMIESFDLEV